MYLNIFIALCAYFGCLFMLCAFFGLSDARAGEDQEGRPGIQWVGRSGLALIVLATLLWVSPANAQVAMWPGQDINFCNGLGAINGGGMVCFHDIVEERIEMTFASPGWHKTFWGTGTAAALLTSLCRISNVHQVTETVFEPGLVRTRAIPCSTGKSGKWVVYKEPKS